MMKLFIPLLALGFIATAQPKGGSPPPLMECGTHGDVDILCGTHSPEDLERTPDGKFLVLGEFVNPRGGRGPAPAPGQGLILFDMAKKTYSKIAVSSDPRKDWGDSACPGPVGDMIVPHGISVLKRSDGKIQLYVVNHGGRQSIEMFELKPAGGSWEAIWHGCALTMAEFNDVAVLPDGSFIATHPTALQAQGGANDLFDGHASGWVARSSQSKGETELPGTKAGYPNGVLVSADGRYMYFNAWTAKEVHKYDLKEGREVGVVKLDFMPDNITWTAKHQMLAAGVKGARGDCPAGSGTPCSQSFGVAEIDPANMQAKTAFDSQGKGALIGGVSVALQVGDSMYIGAFSGDRLVKVPYKK